MIQTSATLRILVAVQPVDFRKGIDGLAAVCRQQLVHDPMSGWAFVFRNRRATAVKILRYDGQGFWLCQKRLSQGHFAWWPRDQARRSGTPCLTKISGIRSQACFLGAILRCGGSQLAKALHAR